MGSFPSAPRKPWKGKRRVNLCGKHHSLWVQESMDCEVAPSHSGSDNPSQTPSHSVFLQEAAAHDSRWQSSGPYATVCQMEFCRESLFPGGPEGSQHLKWEGEGGGAAILQS